MRAPHLGFEETPTNRLLGYGSASRQAVLSVLLLLACTALIGVVCLAYQLRAEQRRLELAVASMRAARGPISASIVKRATTGPSAQALREMDATAARLNVSWSDVLNVIERNTTDEIALLSLEPDGASGEIDLTAEARGLDDVLAYAESLARDTAITAVRLKQHEARTQDAGQPVRLTLSVAVASVKR